MTLETHPADAAPTRRSSRIASALSAPEETGVLTRAELRRRREAAAAAATASSDAAPVETSDILLPTPPAAGESAFVAPEPCALDEFEFAARLFSFTGETPIQRVSVETAPVPVAAALHVAPRRPRRTRVVVQRIAAASFSIGVMAIVGLLAVGTTTPAAAVAAGSASAATTNITASAAKTTAAASGQIQAFVANGSTGAALDRPENYGVSSMAEIASESGVTLFANTWVNNPSSPIQYPFPVGVPISAAFGSVAYASEFAAPHNGVDLTPGEGAEIHAVAAGTVRIATEAGGDYGVTVVIDHIIDGQPVATRYGHMQYGSLQVKQGDKVTAGEVIGRVGQTGKATGPHLHLEVLLGGTNRIDPMPWLAEHTTGTHTVG